MSERKNRQYQSLLVLGGILIVAVFLRFYRYDLPDVINDEVFYGYRSIGLIDFLNSPFQPTPFEWYQEVPLWAKLSFHDHPPLGFWIEHLFFKIFGINLLGLRSLFILAGIASVFLVYLISRRLFPQNQKAALLAAGILAVNNYHVFISRIGLQEGLVIFFILLAVWLFLKTLTPSSSPPYQGGEREGVYFYLTVAATGLAILTKYTAIILLPLFLAYLFWKRRDLITAKRILIGVTLLFLILLPVIIYNLALYKTRGHFDFQFSEVLGQDVLEWQIRPGREVGDVGERVKNLFIHYEQGYGIVFSLLTLLSFWGIFKFRKETGFQFLGLALGFLILLLLLIGPQERFLAMLAPFLAILISANVFLFLSTPSQSPPPLGRGRKWGWGLVICFLLLELVFTINTYFLVSPKGKQSIHYSILRRDANTWGYNQLENYLTSLMSGYYPEQTFPMRFSFAADLQKQALFKAKQEERKPRAILFVYDSQFQGLASLWYLTRHAVYDAWPIITDRSYLEAIKSDPDYFQRSGIKEVVFIKTADTLLEPDEDGKAGRTLETQLLEKGLSSPKLIISPQGKTAFRIFEF